MNLKKPKFWDYKKPNFLAYLLWPLSFILSMFIFFKRNTKKKYSKIKTICVGNIYVGGTGKTPTSIQLFKILENENYKIGFIKKNYPNQKDEQIILSAHGNLFCETTRKTALKNAINAKKNIAIFDDGLQDKTINYDIKLVCFNSQNWIGNGLLLPAGPLREKISSLKKYDAIFLNGNNEDCEKIKTFIKKKYSNLKIFEAEYVPLNIKMIDKESNYIIFAGIGSPKTFKRTLENHNIKILEFLDYPDHYNYSAEDISFIKNKAKMLNAKILTTEKDYLRINNAFQESINYLHVELKIKDEKNLINFLKDKL